MCDLNVKTNSTADGRSVFDVKKEERAIECLRTTRNGMNHARAAVDRFIANPKDVIVRQKKGHLFPDALILSEPFEDPLILCQRGIVILPSKNIFWWPNLRVVAQQEPFSEKEGWDQYNAELPPVEAVRQELVDKLKVVCGAEFFAAHDVEEF